MLLFFSCDTFSPIGLTEIVRQRYSYETDGAKLSDLICVIKRDGKCQISIARNDGRLPFILSGYINFPKRRGLFSQTEHRGKL